MKHLHFVQSLEPLQGGGLGQAALDLHLALREGSQSRLLATKAEGFVGEWPDVIQGVRRLNPKAYFSPMIARVAAEQVAAADVIHGHGFYTAMNWCVGRQVVSKRKSLVYHPQGFFDPWILQRSKGKKRLAEWLFESRNFKSVHWWRALTAKEADQIRAVGQQAPIVVVPNGVNPAAFSTPFSLVGQKARRKMLFLARLHPKKGACLLVEAWARIAQRFPEWEIAIHGPDEGGHAAEIAEAILAAGLGDRCRLIVGAVRAEKWALFDSADLFVLPSYSEGFPVAVLEAAARGRPVVMTSECNFPELGRVEGAWISLPEADDLSKHLALALGCSDQERIQRGLNGQKLIRENYQWSQLSRVVEEACRQYC